MIETAFITKRMISNNVIIMLRIIILLLMYTIGGTHTRNCTVLTIYIRNLTYIIKLSQ